MSVEDIWNVLKYGIQNILKKIDDGLSFEDLYR